MITEGHQSVQCVPRIVCNQRQSRLSSCPIIIRIIGAKLPKIISADFRHLDQFYGICCVNVLLAIWSLLTGSEQQSIYVVNIIETIFFSDIITPLSSAHHSRWTMAHGYWSAFLHLVVVGSIPWEIWRDGLRAGVMTCNLNHTPAECKVQSTWGSF